MIPLHLWSLIERLANLHRREITAANLAPVHGEVLRYLLSCNRYSNTPGAVAEYLGLTNGAVSRTAGTLVRRGYIVKRTDRHDRRLVHLELTPAGRDAASTLDLPTWTKSAEAIQVDQRETAEAVLAELLRTLQQQRDHKTFGACGTCRFLMPEGPGTFRCGLTREPLTPYETHLICREHEPPASQL